MYAHVYIYTRGVSHSNPALLSLLLISQKSEATMKTSYSDTTSPASHSPAKASSLSPSPAKKPSVLPSKPKETFSKTAKELPWKQPQPPIKSDKIHPFGTPQGKKKEAKKAKAKGTTTKFPITIIPLWFAKKQLAKLTKTATVNNRGCFIPSRKPREDGYVRFTVTQDQRKKLGIPGVGELSYYIHQLAFYCKHGTVPTRNETHISHLCDDPRCFNAEDLVEEDPAYNNSRKNCRACCPWCGKNPCPHIPQCKP